MNAAMLAAGPFSQAIDSSRESHQGLKTKSLSTVYSSLIPMTEIVSKDCVMSDSLGNGALARLMSDINM